MALLTAFAVLMPIKVQNMILGGGIIRSGGRTKYIMMIDMLGTWLIGVPLALLTGRTGKVHNFNIHVQEQKMDEYH